MLQCLLSSPHSRSVPWDLTRRAVMNDRPYAVVLLHGVLPRIVV